MHYPASTRTKPGIAAPLAAVLMSHPHLLTEWPELPDSQLQERQEIIVVQSQRHHLPIAPLGMYPAPREPQVMHSDHHDWVVIVADDDPLGHDRDGFPIPSHNLDDLKRIRSAGLDFDRIYVVHELPSGTISDPAQISAEMLTPGPSSAARATAQQQARIARTALTMATLPLLGAGLIATAAVATAAVVGSSLAGLDPILIGVNLKPGSPVGSWYYLTHWVYE